MSLNGILALLWLAFSFCFLAGFTYFLGWLDDRARQRNGVTRPNSRVILVGRGARSFSMIAASCGSPLPFWS